MTVSVHWESDQVRKVLGRVLEVLDIIDCLQDKRRYRYRAPTNLLHVVTALVWIYLQEHILCRYGTHQSSQCHWAISKKSVDVRAPIMQVPRI